MEMTITGYDTIELVQKDDLEAIAERVWVDEDMKRVLPLVNGKSVSAASKFIQDTENVQRKIAMKLLNNMEANKMFEWRENGKHKVIEQTKLI